MVQQLLIVDYLKNTSELLNFIHRYTHSNLKLSLEFHCIWCRISLHLVSNSSQFLMFLATSKSFLAVL